MTGKTSTSTYALIEGPVPDDPSYQWTATIFRKGYKRTTVVHAYSEQRVKEMCIARGVTEFATRGGQAAPPSTTAA